VLVHNKPVCEETIADLRELYAKEKSEGKIRDWLRSQTDKDGNRLYDDSEIDQAMDRIIARNRRLYRGMTDADGLPLTGTSGRTLGARPGPGRGTDIPVVDGNVQPGQGGMSVAPDHPLNLPPHRRPSKYDGTGNDPVWEINEGELGPRLKFDQDSPGHGTIQPNAQMTWAEYLEALYETANRWRKK
jgi:hypothetical protein